MERKRNKERPFVKKGKKKAYTGSAYWDSVVGHSRIENTSNRPEETKFANPDISEEGSLFELYKEQKEIRDRKDNLKHLMKIAVRNCGLSPQEAVVVQRVIYDQVPAVDVAKQMQVSKQAVSDAMRRATVKIQKKVKILTLQYGI